MTTTWKIFDMKRALSTGLITEIQCGCVVEHEKGVEREFFQIELTGNPKSPGFIMYDDLTEEDVLGWINAEIGTEKITEVEATLQARLSTRIYNMNNPTEAKGLPW